MIVVAIVAALAACSRTGSDEVDAESAAILARVPVGSSFKSASAAMMKLGFTCNTARRQFTDSKGNARETELHLVCERDQSEWLICTRRTRAILIQLNGRLSNVLVNVGRVCA
ncbi:MAG TPA: hypothetical protein VH881_00045 [Burkholderiales bacterium]